MSSPRLRRLRLDQERLEARFRDSTKIRVVSTSGVPAEKYEIAYAVRGLCTAPNDAIFERAEHVVEIKLSLGYPRRAPQCKMLTPIFHPNFDEVSVCIGDFWAPSEGLDDLVVRIGRMIAYQEYNVKSPLNGLAARWAEQNAHLLPVDPEEIAPASRDAGAEEQEPAIVVTLGDFVEAAESPAAEESVAAPQPSIDASPSGFEAPAEKSAAFSPGAVSSAVFLPRLDFGMISVAIEPGRLTVGRAPGNIVQLTHDSVSSHHAEIFRTDNQITLRDLSSTNGTFVNGGKIVATMLSEGDRVYFGDLEAVYLAGA